MAASGDVIVIGAEDDDFGTQSGQGSSYVFTRSGAIWSQHAKLTAEDGMANDLFGHAVAVRGDTVLTGAPANQVGLNAQQGAVYTFTVAPDFGQAVLSASDGVSSDDFGRSVAISGTTAVVGAPRAGAHGAAYIFVRPFGSWTFQQKLTGNAGDNFGYAVAIEGDRIVVGELGRKAPLGIEGAAYVFVRINNTWSQQQKLQADDGNEGNYFGCAVALSGNTVVIGAKQTFTPGEPNHPAGAYVYTLSGNVWSQQQKLIPNNGSILGFGTAVAVEGDVVAVGSPEDSQIGGNSGAVFFFTRSNGTWSQQQYFSSGVAGAHLGTSASLSKDTAVIGAPVEKIGQNSGQGAAYVYQRNGASWGLAQKLKAGDGAADDNFGLSVGLSGDLIVVGAAGDDVIFSQQGSAYLFKRNGATWDEQKKLVAGGPEAKDYFGIAVAVSGDKIVVGASGDNNDKGIAYAFGIVPCSGFPITVNPAALPNGTTGTVYSQTISASGGASPYQFSISAGGLPPGMTLSQNGLLSGTPTVPGTYNFTITALATTLCPGVRSYALTITGGCPAIGVIPANATLPAGQAGQSYNLAFGASNGAAPYSFAISTGALPNGLTLAGNGVLSGAPTAFGNFNFTVRATDLNGCQGIRAYSLTIAPPCAAITVNPATLPDGMAGAAYSQTMTALGGTAPHTFTISAGVLPGGMSLASGGALTGMPSATGVFNITIKATDANGCMGTHAYILTINGGAMNNGLQFYPLAHPVRLLDTRTGQPGCDAPGAKITSGTSRTQTAAGRTCDGLTIPANAAALVGNATSVQSGGGYFTLYPSDIAKPNSANSNFAANQILNSLFTVRLGANDGAFKIFVSTDTDIVVDITGYYAPPSGSGLYFHPLPKPVRLLDTRSGQTACYTPGAALQGDTVRTQIGTTTCDNVLIPAGAQALTGNATTVGPQANGFLTLYPADAARPLIASANFQPGVNLNSPFMVGLAPSGEFNIYVASTTDLVIDVTGYYSTQLNDSNGQGLLFNALAAPTRLLDTRAGQTGCFTPGAPMTGGTPYTQAATGVCSNIPAAAQAVVGNATTINAAANGYLTFWPSDANQPFIATSNYRTNITFNRHFTVGLGNDGAFKRYAASTTDLVVDLVGFFAP